MDLFSIHLVSEMKTLKVDMMLMPCEHVGLRVELRIYDANCPSRTLFRS
jgi:hypothetical protein